MVFGLLAVVAAANATSVLRVGKDVIACSSQRGREASCFRSAAPASREPWRWNPSANDDVLSEPGLGAPGGRARCA